MPLQAKKSPRQLTGGAVLAALVVCVALALLAAAAPALAAAPEAAFFKLESHSAPTNLPLKGEGIVLATVANLGDKQTSGSITITDTLPANFEVTEARATELGTPHNLGQFPCSSEGTPAKVVCTFSGTVPPFEQLEVEIRVKTNFGAPAEPTNEVSVSGSGAPATKPSVRALKVNGQPTGFGVESWEVSAENEEFGAANAAGSHPFQLTTMLRFNQTLQLDPSEPKTVPAAPALLKNLDVKLPPGLVGNANVVGKQGLPQQCPDASFGANANHRTNACPENTAIGVALVTFNDPVTLDYDTFAVPVFNLVPAPGEPAKFGFDFSHVPVVLDTSVRTGEDYGVTVSVKNASQSVQVLSTRVTIWGTPNDERHKSARGWECLGDGGYVQGFEPPKPCTSLEGEPEPFLLLPTSCGKLTFPIDGESWSGQSLSAQAETGPEEELTGCESLPFTPSIGVEPDSHAASTPTGMTVHVHLPQQTTLEQNGKAEADVHETTLALPEGLQANAGAANELEACSAGALGFSLPGVSETGPGDGAQLENDHFSSTLPEASPGLPEPPCPQGSKIGSVTIKTPLLEHSVEGGVYLAAQDTNPFEPPLVLYIVAQEPKSKVLVKLAGQVTVNPSTGQLVSTFRGTPQVPFEDLELHLFNGKNNDGERAAQATPARCGEYAAQASFENWSKPGATPAEARFGIDSGPEGSACPAGPTLPFAPAVVAGPTNTQAGAFTEFPLTIGRADGNQALTGLSVHLPQGAAAMLSSVTPCPIAVADGGGCGPASEIGESATSSGLGKYPVTLGGRVFLTQGFDGAPFGISVFTPAEHVGPFDIGNIVANSTIRVDPNTAAATITAVETRINESTGHTTVLGTLPTMIKGVPVQLKQVYVKVNRPNFEFNPTNCNPASITGAPMAVSTALSGAEGGSAAASIHYGVTGCTGLAFTPKLTASVVGPGSKPNGTTFAVKVQATHGQANIGKTFLTLPVVLPSRLSTIQQACLAATFEKNPASCDEGSNIGYAVAHTPVLKNPLVGPAYLVSHGNAAFPDVEFVLQGEGITLVLDGKTDIKNGITYSRFETVPDAPVETFETVLPAGPHSALTANVPESQHFNLCTHSKELVMPTEITGQDGAILKQTTQIALVGCPKVLPFKAKSKLQVALEKCRKKYKGNSKTMRKKRAACEAQARKKYGPKKKSSKKKK